MSLPAASWTLPDRGGSGVSQSVVPLVKVNPACAIGGRPIPPAQIAGSGVGVGVGLGVWVGVGVGVALGVGFAVGVGVGGTKQPLAVHASQQLETTPTHAWPLLGARHDDALLLTLHLVTPRALVVQQVTAAGRPQVDWRTQPSTLAEHPWGMS